MSEQQNQFIGLCKTFVDRSKTQGFRGAKRDAAAVEFFVGAYALATAANLSGLESKISMFLAFKLCPRGAGEVDMEIERAINAGEIPA